MATKDQVFSAILRYWPLIVGFLLVFAAGVETRYQVQQLINSRAVDVAQWKLIRKQGETIVEQDGRLHNVEKHVTTDSIQAWGAFQRIVDEDHILLRDHILSHPE